MNTITVAELIARLQNEDPNARVIFTSMYGDRGRTEQAHAIRGRVEEVMLKETGYSDSGFAVADEDDRDGDVEATTYVRIS